MENNILKRLKASKKIKKSIAELDRIAKKYNATWSIEVSTPDDIFKPNKE